MSRKLFEYFFTPDELEPYYSELTGSTRGQKNRSQPARNAQERKMVARRSSGLSDDGPPSSSTGTDKQQTSLSNDVHEKQSATEVRGDEPRRDQTVDEKPLVLTATTPSSNHGTARTDREMDNENGGDAKRELGRTRVRNMLSVHALGQFVFCPRAAILAAERGDERDLDEPIPRLTYLPNFDLERIEEELAAKLKQTLLALVLVVALPTSMVLSLRNETPGYFYLAAFTLFITLLWSADLLATAAKLAIRRAIALRADGREPEPSFSGTESVNWWSMLNAGFEPITYQRPFQHPELPLEGCPWRVLHKGSLRIPVIKAGGDRLGNEKNKLFHKHEVRLVAYALLLEADGHHQAPYGLVFPADSPHGLAFAITDNHRRHAAKLLADFEQQLNDSQQRNVQPGIPDNRNLCANCDYGKPVATSVREINSLRKTGEQIVVLQSRSDQLFHCDCGDRFGSAPPHRDAVRMGLRAILE